ncbi:MAG: amidohydrolase family protein [Planctomycetaceae bacterium]|nr:amidohydrolase family protein [Planctomycetaceae bacterium]
MKRPALTIPQIPLRVLALTAGLLAAGFPAVAQDKLAISGATIIPVSGERIENGTILISDGRIEAVGADLDIPVEAKVIDASGQFVMPGIINVHSAAAMSQANEQNSNVPFLSVVDSIDPIRSFFGESRRNGVTTAAVVPGNSTMIGGRAAIVKTAGTYVDDMIVKRDAGLKISMAPASGSSRMSHYARLRKELQKVKDANEKDAEQKKADAKKAAAAKTEEKKEGDTESKPAAAATPTSSQSETAKVSRETLTKLLAGELPAIIYCQTSMDVPQALTLVEEFGLKPILVLGRDCYKAAGLVAKKKIPVVLDSTMVYWRTDPITRKDEKIVLPKIFSDAGASFVFQAADSGTTLGTHYYWYQAATAVRYGMSADAALKALTLDSAALLGIDGAVGSIEAGKDADLVILSGEPLSVSTWVETTIVGGKVVYEKSKDEELRLLLNPEEDAN